MDARQPRRPPRRLRYLLDHEGRAGFLHWRIRLSVPVGQIRSDLRSGVQPRRHGKSGSGHVHRQSDLPGQGHRRELRVAGERDPARNGAHVVRRPGDHEVVGRPVAQGVVRRLHGRAGAGRGDPLHRRLGDLRTASQGVGVHAGPLSDHAPDRRRHPRRRGCETQLRRHHLRQGRVRAQAARGLRRPGGVLRWLAPVLQALRLPQYRARRLPRMPRRGGPRPGHRQLGQRMAGHLRSLRTVVGTDDVQRCLTVCAGLRPSRHHQCEDHSGRFGSRCRAAASAHARDRHVGTKGTQAGPDRFLLLRLLHPVG